MAVGAEQIAQLAQHCSQVVVLHHCAGGCGQAAFAGDGLCLAAQCGQCHHSAAADPFDHAHGIGAGADLPHSFFDQRPHQQESGGAAVTDLLLKLPDCAARQHGADIEFRAQADHAAQGGRRVADDFDFATGSVVAQHGAPARSERGGQHFCHCGNTGVKVLAGVRLEGNARTGDTIQRGRRIFRFVHQQPEQAFFVRSKILSLVNLAPL